MTSSDCWLFFLQWDHKDTIGDSYSTKGDKFELITVGSVHFFL